MSLLSTTQYSQIATVPLSLPQTEMQCQRSIQVAVIVLGLGQRLELRSLNLHLIKILTPGVVPVLETTRLGLVSAGLYLGSSMATGGIALVTATIPGVSSYHPAQPVLVSTPGIYKVFVANNSNNVDVAVALTGSARIFS